MSKTTDANQRLVDESAAHINAQGRKSGRNLACEYTLDPGNPDSLHCAFWPAIKDYDPSMENNAASQLIELWCDNLHAWAFDLNPVLADNVQAAHDNIDNGPDFVDMFNDDLCLVCDEFGLTKPLICL